MDISTLAHQYDGLSPSIIEKAKEYSRLAILKGYDTTSLRNANPTILHLARPAACLELACRTLQEPCESNRLRSLCGIPKRQYLFALRAIQNLLRLDSQLDYSVQSLCYRFGCLQVVDKATCILEQYKQRLVKKIAQQPQTVAQLDRPVFKAAALFLTASYDQITVDKHALVRSVNCSKAEFDSVCGSMKTICEDFLTRQCMNKDGKIKKKVRKRRTETKEKKQASDNCDAVLQDSSRKGTTATPEPSLKRQKSLQKIKKMIEKSRGDAENVDPSSCATDSSIKTTDTTATSKQDYIKWKASMLEKMNQRRNQQKE